MYYISIDTFFSGSLFISVEDNKIYQHKNTNMIWLNPTTETEEANDTSKGSGSTFYAVAFLAVVILFFYYGTTTDTLKEQSRAIKNDNNDKYFNRSTKNKLAEAYMRENNAAVAAERRRYKVDNMVVSGGDKTEKFSVDDVKNAVAVVTNKISQKSPGGSDKGKSKVIQVKSHKDGRMYYVADDLPQKQKAADILAEVSRRSQYLLQSVAEQLEGNKRIKAADGTDITDNMKTLTRKHYKKPPPLAEYNNPSDMTVGSNSDKGALIEHCLRGKDDPTEWNSMNTLFRVHVHELAHSADFHYREDGSAAHGPVFKRLHQHLLGIAENLGIYNCAQYKASGQRFCSLKLDENYCGSKI